MLGKLADHGLTVERSAACGMQPQSSRLLDLGMWFLTHRRDAAMWWYNRVLLPLGMRFQKKLAFILGMMDCEKVDEILLVCRRGGAPRRRR